jgi:hypothetical protein
MESDEVESWPGHEGGQPGDDRSCASLRPRHTVHPEHKVQRFQHHVGRASCVQIPPERHPKQKVLGQTRAEIKAENSG